jgi:hypothetical protein
MVLEPLANSDRSSAPLSCPKLNPVNVLRGQSGLAHGFLRVNPLRSHQIPPPCEIAASTIEVLGERSSNKRFRGTSGLFQ